MPSAVLCWRLRRRNSCSHSLRKAHRVNNNLRCNWGARRCRKSVRRNGPLVPLPTVFLVMNTMHVCRLASGSLSGQRRYDVSKFARMHPGGERVFRSVAGKDATEAFWSLHRGEDRGGGQPRWAPGFRENGDPMEE
eukprot:gene10599-biopygen12336